MTHLDDALTQLEGLAKAATPGPYTVKPSSNCGARLHREGIHQSDLAMEPEADCALFAACSPETILALARVAKAADELDKLMEIMLGRDYTARAPAVREALDELGRAMK